MIIKVVTLLPSCWGTTSLITFVFSFSLTVLNSWTHKNHFVGDWEWFPRYSWHNPTQSIARKLQPERQLWLLDTCPPTHVSRVLHTLDRSYSYSISTTEWLVTFLWPAFGHISWSDGFSKQIFKFSELEVNAYEIYDW